MRKSKANAFGVILTIILLIILINVTNSSREHISIVEKASNVLVMPFQNGFTYIKNKVTKNNSFFENIDNLKQQNEKLLEENKKLEQDLRELEVIKAENRILKENMALTEKYKEYKTVPAEVISEDYSNYSNILIINSGENEGVKANMPVISDKGLVGHVISTTSNTAKVLVITDPSSSVSAKTSKTRESVVCKGTNESNSNLKLQYIPTDVTLSAGDTIETSGMGGIYPKGIYIGTVKEVINQNNKIDEYAIVETAVDFKKLETVLVITQ